MRHETMKTSTMSGPVGLSKEISPISREMLTAEFQEVFVTCMLAPVGLLLCLEEDSNTKHAGLTFGLKEILESIGTNFSTSLLCEQTSDLHQIEIGGQSECHTSQKSKQ